MEEIDIKEIFFEFWKNKILIITLVVIGIVAGILYSAYLVKPMYRSSTTVILSTSNSEGGVSSSITTNDITMNQKLVATYSELIKSKSVIKQVVERLGVSISNKNIKVQSKQNTELLEITVLYNDPNKAADIANTLVDVFSDKVKEAYNIDNVSVIDIAEPDSVPYNVNMLKTTGIFAIGALFIACVIIFIRMFFNNTIRSQEEAEKFFGLPILAVIPEVKDCRGDKKV